MTFSGRSSGVHSTKRTMENRNDGKYNWTFSSTSHTHSLSLLRSLSGNVWVCYREGNVPSRMLTRGKKGLSNECFESVVKRTSLQLKPVFRLKRFYLLVIAREFLHWNQTHTGCIRFNISEIKENLTKNNIHKKRMEITDLVWMNEKLKSLWVWR